MEHTDGESGPVALVRRISSRRVAPSVTIRRTTRAHTTRLASAAAAAVDGPFYLSSAEKQTTTGKE